MSMDMQHFSNGEFDLDLIPDGDTFKVVASGLAKSLGFSEAAIMTRNMPEDEKGSVLVQTPGGEQRALAVTESGFYRTIGQRQAARIKDPEIRALVERFQSWVYGDVLPSIRRHGGYLTEQKVEEVLSDPDTIIRLATDLKAERARAALAEKKAGVLGKWKRATEAGDGLKLSDFRGKYFTSVPKMAFFAHLYEKKWIKDERGTRTREDGTKKDGPNHMDPLRKSNGMLYRHEEGTYGGKKRLRTRVKPDGEIAFRDALIREGLTPNEHSTGLVLFSDEDVKELGA